MKKILTVIMVIVLLSGMLVSVSAETLFENNFENDEVGGMADGFGKAGGYIVRNDVGDAVVYTDGSNNVLRYTHVGVKNSKDINCTMQTKPINFTSPKGGASICEYKLKATFDIKTAGSNDWFNSSLIGAATHFGILQFRSDGAVMLRSTLKVGAYKVNEWNDIKIVVRTNEDLADFYINDKIIFKDFKLGMTATQYAAFQMFFGSKPMDKIEALIDNFKAYTTDSYEAPKDVEPVATPAPQQASSSSDSTTEPSSVLPSITFSDLSGHWAENIVYNMVERGLFNGYEDGTFMPDNNIKIDEFIKTLVTARGRGLEGQADQFAAQRKGIYWAELYIDIAMSYGFIENNEYSDYTIPINRQQMAKMISMALRENIEVDAEALQKEIKDFDSISEEYKNVILRVYAAGIVGGTTDGEFNPLGIATRAEAAAMLERLLDTSKRLRAVTAQSSVPENPNYVIPSPFNHAIDGDSVEIPGITSKSEKGTIWTYPAYDQADKSPDYEVTLQQGGGDAVDSFAFYSFKQPSYNMHNMEGEVMRSYASTIENREAHSNTTTIFSFEGGPITVRVKVKPGAKNITLPLTSAKVLPSSYNIPCKIENSDTIVFTLDRPEKFFVIPNYDTVWNKYTELAKEHTTVQKWQDFSTQMNEPNFKGKNLTVEEGFLNPIVIVAHEKENVSYIPDKAGSKVLMVKPGDLLTQEKISEHDVIWFTPGVHDLSNLGTNPEHEVYIREGQTVYLEGGSYVMARFYSKDDTDKGMAYIVGRGILSGRNHKWVNLPNMCPLLDLFDEVNGITMTEPSGVAILRTKKVVDTALVGTWHYNITGIITTNGCVVENCLFMSDDDNVVLQTNVSMKHIVIWQQSNAHPMMEQGNAGRDYANTSVEDVDIIAYFRFPSPQPWHQVGLGAIAVIRGTHYSLENFSFKDIRIESPYLFRAFTVYNLNTNIINPGWFSATTEKDHSRIKGLTFENITVTSPIIFMTSLVGSPYEDSMENVLFKNIVINGAVVDETNLSKYIEVDGNLKGIRFEK